MMERQAESLRLGQRLNGYVVESVLGEGAASTTYFARDPATDRSVTIREYFPRALSRRDTKSRLQPVSENARVEYADGLGRFIQKARNLAIYSDEKAGRAVTCFEANGTAYLVMASERVRDPGAQPATLPVTPPREPKPRDQTPAKRPPMVSLDETIDEGPLVEADSEQWREMLDGPVPTESTLAEPIESLPTPAPPPSSSGFPDTYAGYVSAADTVPPSPAAGAPPPVLAAYTPRRPGPRRVRVAAAFFAILLLFAGSGWFVVDRLAGKGPAQQAKGNEVLGAGPSAPVGPAAAATKRDATDAGRGEAAPQKKKTAFKRRFKQGRGLTAQPEGEQAFRRADQSFYKSGDYPVAFKWYRKAAEQGHARAQFALGYMYDLGKGVGRDRAAAVKWFRKAAEQGHVDAQYNIGFMYSNGTGVKKDYIKGLKWFRRAAAQCDMASQANIGFMYEKGWGVQRDVTEAYFWYRLALATYGKSSIKNDARLEGIALRADIAAKRTGKQLTADRNNSVASRVKSWTPAATKRVPSWCR